MVFKWEKKLRKKLKNTMTEEEINVSVNEKKVQREMRNNRRRERKALKTGLAESGATPGSSSENLGERNSEFGRSGLNSESMEENSDMVIPDKPPPGLRGKALGLWHRDKKRMKKKLRKEVQQVKKSIPLELPAKKQQEIRRILNRISMSTPPNVSNAVSSSGHLDDKYSHIEESDFKRRFLQSLSGSIEDKMSKSMVSHLCYSRNASMDARFRENQKAVRNLRQYQEMLKFREKLPAFNKRFEIVDMVEKNQVILISGETGCGKTTQTAQFLLDYEMVNGRGSTCHIVCTQPRRISAISVAERVAQERAERLGESVGYQIRLEKVLPRKTASILFCTTGVLLQHMQRDPVLSSVSHVIIDEIHERDTVSDFLITILKDVIKMRKDLKVILMSATLNAEQFSKYFNNCPSINIPGFTYPVKEFYLEDVLQITGFQPKTRAPRSGGLELKKYIANKKYQEEYLEPYLRTNEGGYPNWVLNALKAPDIEEINLDLIYELVVHICMNERPGAILIFLPGWDKIQALHNILQGFNNSRCLIIPLHSMMPTMQQKSVFDRPPPGVRKIVIATNIAETSITIDDVVYVIDCGKIKIKSFDINNNISTLCEEWVSLANAKQRRGRAGRVQEGVCYHLYTKPREQVFDSYQLPEMLRTRLEEVILQAKVLQLGKIAPFLEKVMDPPSPKSVELSLNLLMSMNALDDDEHLTPLGYHLAHLPIDPQAGKMILLGGLFGCLDPITTIAAGLSFKDPFVVPLGKETEVNKVRMELSKNSKSDHLVMVEALDQWRKAESMGRGWNFTSRNFLSYNTLNMLKDMKKQFTNHLYEMNFVDNNSVTEGSANFHSDNSALVKAVICAGLYPNIAVVRKIRTTKKGRNIIIITTPENGTVNLHPKSINSYNSEFESRFFVYYQKIRSSGIYLHDTTMVFPLALIFFCHKFTIEDNADKKIIKIAKKVEFSCDPDAAQLIIELRAWLDWLLEHKVSHPGTINWSQNNDEVFILQAIIELISSEYDMYSFGDDMDEDQNDEGANSEEDC